MWSVGQVEVAGVVAVGAEMRDMIVGVGFEVAAVDVG